MAELRVRQGRLAEAEQLLTGREEHPSSLCALAHLRIADGHPQVAAALLERALPAAEGNAIRTTQLLAPLVEARLACGDPQGARAAAGAAGRPGRGVRHPAGRSPRGAGRGAREPGRGPPRRGRGARPPRADRVRPAGHAPARGRGAAGAGAGAGGGLARRGPRRGACRVRRLPRAGGLAGHGRRRGGAARAGRGHRRPGPEPGRADRARARGARAGGAAGCRTRRSPRRW